MSKFTAPRQAGASVIASPAMRSLNPFHGSYAWKKTRRIAKLQANCICQNCGRFLPEPGALHVHHKMPVARHPAVALEPANFMVICSPCHNELEPRTGSRITMCNVDGSPTDPAHPWYERP